METKRLADYNVYDDSIVKITNCNGILDVLYLSSRNNDIRTQKINKDEYVVLDTGEILEYKHTINRSEDLGSIRESIKNLRNLINNNFTGGKNELWITLTFDKNKIYNPSELCPIFEKFIKRLRYKLNPLKIDYIYVPEPHEKGDWHIHLLLKADKKLYISNKDLNILWSHGHVKVNRLKDVDNVGAYVSAYLIDIKEGEQTKKGARLYLYPPNHKLYRASKGIKKPESFFTKYSEVKNNLDSKFLTFKNTLHIETPDGFESTIHHEYYNLNKK